MNGDTPEWAELLEAIYEENLVWSAVTDNYHEDGPIYGEGHPVYEIVDMDPQQIQKNLAFLLETGLIGTQHIGLDADVPRPGKELVTGISEEARREGTHLGLTERGFAVAHERQMQRRRDERENQRLQQQEKNEERRTKQQHTVNRAIAFLTLGLLAVTATDSAVRAFIGANNIPGAYIATLAGAVLTLIFAGVLFFSGLLSPYSE
jgi:hypothetical protein